jgi:hypothetical protein
MVANVKKAMNIKKGKSDSSLEKVQENINQIAREVYGMSTEEE